MTTIYLGKRRRNNNSFLYRVEAGNHIVSGTYEQVLDDVRRTFHGSRVSIDFIGREYIPLNERELSKFEGVLRLDSVLERKLEKKEPVREHVYTDQKEWSEMMERIEKMLKKH